MTKSEISGVIFFPLKTLKDGRGSLCELFRHDRLEDSHRPAMGYMSQTMPGVSRGPHEHESQSDLFCFVGPGDFELVLWEQVGSGDPYKEVHIVGETNPVSVMVPPGVIHAYRNVSNKPGLVFNFPNRLYGGPGGSYPVDEIRHESDPRSPYVI